MDWIGRLYDLADGIVGTLAPHSPHASFRRSPLLVSHTVAVDCRYQAELILIMCFC